MCQPSNDVIFLSFSHLFHVSPPCDGKIRRAVQQTAVAEKQQEKRSHPALSSPLLFSLSLHIRSTCSNDRQSDGAATLPGYFNQNSLPSVFIYLPFTISLSLLFFFLFGLLQFRSVHFFIWNQIIPNNDLYVILYVMICMWWGFVYILGTTNISKRKVKHENTKIVWTRQQSPHGNQH